MQIKAKLTEEQLNELSIAYSLPDIDWKLVNAGGMNTSYFSDSNRSLSEPIGTSFCVHLLIQ